MISTAENKEDLSLKGRSLVLGANGFLGSHVTKQLLAFGNDVRVLSRAASDTRALDAIDLEDQAGSLEWLEGSLFEADCLRAAMQGVDYVFYCVVDTRSWLRDPGPLWHTNVEQLKLALDVIAEFPIRKLVFTSSYTTIGIREEGEASEADAFNWGAKAPAYVHSRVAAEREVLRRAKHQGLPAVACCVSNTYGPEDYAPTPHGNMLWSAATGKLPVSFPGGAESVGVVDAAQALILAASRGRIAERYVISTSYLSMRELCEKATAAYGKAAPKGAVPLWLMYSVAHMAELLTRAVNKDNHMHPSSIFLLSKMKCISNAKACDELAWRPRPIDASIGEAIAFYRSRTSLDGEG